MQHKYSFLKNVAPSQTKTKGGDPLEPFSSPPPTAGAPLLNGAFFGHHALFGAGAAVLPPDLRTFVGTLALCATAAYARASGLLGGSDGPTGGSWLDRLQKDAQVRPVTTVRAVT